MIDWLDTLARHLDDDLVRVVVVATRGSVPREAGASMLVGRSALHGTIGGGHLEFRATAIARDMLARHEDVRLDRFTLGATLGQCCGGAVELWFERWSSADRPFVDHALTQRDQDRSIAWQLETRIADAVNNDAASVAAARPQAMRDTARPGVQRALRAASPHDGARAPLPQRTRTHFIEALAAPTVPLYLFGAGHVGQALVRVLDGLPFKITWIDSRADLFPAILMSGQQEGISPVSVHVTDEPADEARHAPPGTHFLIMTHSHDLDYEICRAALTRADAASVGLIGSATKAARFRHRLAAQGVASTNLTCPLGLLPSGNKLPAAIAISVAAQLLERLAAPHAARKQTPRRASA